MSPAADCIMYILTKNRKKLYIVLFSYSHEKSIDQRLQGASVMQGPIVLHWHATNRLANDSIMQSI